jgi:hypothetical protein
MSLKITKKFQWRQTKNKIVIYILISDAKKDTVFYFTNNYLKVSNYLYI